MAPILQELDREWDELVNSPRARRALMRWVNTTPDLAGNDTLTEVCARRRDPARCRPVMKALADLASGDEVAARTLLKMMMPGLVCLAVHVGNDDEAAIDEVISLAWERICTYPSHRGGSVAANIQLDVRKRYRQHRVIEDPNSIELSEDTIDESVSVEDEVLGHLLIGELQQAQLDGLMSIEVLATIIRTRLFDEPLSELAAEQNLTPQRLCHRRWRAEVRLRDLPLAG